MGVFEGARSWDPDCIKAAEHKFSNQNKETALPCWLFLSDRLSETCGSEPTGNHVKQAVVHGVRAGQV